MSAGSHTVNIGECAEIKMKSNQMTKLNVNTTYEYPAAADPKTVS